MEIQKAHIVIFIVSIDFFINEFLQNLTNKIHEKKTGNPNLIQVIQVIVRSCDFNYEFGALTVLPYDRVPISEAKFKDKAWTEVAAGIKKVFENLKNNNASKSENKQFDSSDCMRATTLPLSDEIFVSSGTFLMGAKHDHKVDINGFYIGKCPVTFAEYDQYCEQTNIKKPKDEWGREKHPIIHITWYDAVQYCNWLSKCHNLPTSYTIDGVNVTLLKDPTGFRLPTESEWEFAAAGGEKQKRFKYSGSDNIHEVAWNNDHPKNGTKKTKEVGSLNPNKLGIHDMSGNVWEWCEDNWHRNIKGIPDDGSPFKEGNFSSKVVKRGGSHYITAQYCSIYHRDSYDKSQSDNEHGFRIARSVSKNTHEFNKIIRPASGTEPNASHKPKDNPKSTPNKKKRLPTVVILTAIKEEYSAVRKHLKEIVDADRNDTSYESGLFEYNNIEIARVIIRECGAKNTNAAQETERGIRYFKPDIMFFVGIAGSRKPNDFSIGDVIFPEKVYSYEGGKSEKDSFVARPDIAAITYTLKEIAKKERRKEDWKALIKGDWPAPCKADLGVIASGEQVVEHYNSEIGKILTANYNDTSAVEMEGFGFANAANKQGRETSKVLIGIVRGISDIIEQPSATKKNKIQDRRPPHAKEFASDTAAAFAFWLILKAL